MPLRTLLAVHAHPDDETISTGGLLARSSAEGVRVVLVTCTGGEAGEIADLSLATPSTLGLVRARELREAVRILGVSRSVSLGFRDSGLPPSGAPGTFVRAHPSEAAGRLVRVMREERPQVVVTYDPRGGYGHPDHVRTHDVTVEAFTAAGDPSRYADAGPAWQPARLYFIVFPRSAARRAADAFREAGIPAPPSALGGSLSGDASEDWGTPDEMVDATLDVAAHAETKRRALYAHRTQRGAVDFFFRLPPAALRRVWATESFARGDHGPRPPTRASDLFEGLP